MQNTDFNLQSELGKYELLDYQVYAENPQKYPLPVLKKFENQDQKLWYFGANHSYDFSDKMFSEIESIFKKFQPDLVILEGSLKINSLTLSYKKQILDKTKEEIVTQKGEYGLGLWLAFNNFTEVFCPEPNLVEMVSFLEDKFEKEQIFCSFIIEMANQYSNLIGEDRDLKQYLQEEIDWQKGELKNQKNWQNFDFSYSNFLKIFEKITIFNFEQTQGNFWEELVDPIAWKTKNYKWNILNDLAKENCNFRDRFILTKIQQKNQLYDKIMIIYGGSHLYVQEKALNKMFHSFT